ncbi:MAG: phosphoribosylanthranilate isomerase [Candidatus Omnitrophica bacterium]|nr:phosphoribosylanthranilate isomerase [Candidatus Omnitrophota bacterium]
MTLIKICGIMNKVDAVRAAELGVDMLGFVFYKKSRRYVDPAAVREIINELPDSIRKVGVFVDEDQRKVRAIAEDSGVDTLQFHGSETPWYCADFKGDYKVIKAFRLKGAEDLKTVNDYDVDFVLLDNYSSDSVGGTGEAFDWNILKDYEFLHPEILSGGLNPENVTKALADVIPYGVDVSTGVEDSPGKKNFELMKRFVEAVRKA